MSTPSPARVDSIRQRLLNHAREAGEEFQLTLDRYAVERLLYRLSISRHRNDFLLKGAMLFRHWFDQQHRPTRDADFLGLGSPDPARIDAIVRELCQIEADDGLVFDLSDLRVNEIRETARQLILPRFPGHPDRRLNIAYRGEADEDQEQDQNSGKAGAAAAQPLSKSM